MSKSSFIQLRSLRVKILFLSTIGMLVLLVTVYLYALPLYEKSFVESQKVQIHAATEIAYSIIETYAKLVDEKKMSLTDAQEMVKEQVRQMRFNSTDYLFVYNFEGNVVAHGLDQSLEGKNRLDVTDPHTGRHYVQDMIDLAKGPDQGGFVQYYFPKVKGGANIAKMSYVKASPKWQWLVGTGVYQDTIFAKVHEFELSVLFGFLVVFAVVASFSVWFSLGLTKSINNVVNDLTNHSSEVLKSIQLVSTTGESLSSSSTSAAASLEETMAALEEITAMIKANSDSAQQAATISESARTSAKQGEKELSNLTDSMKDISASSRKIEDIINVIDDIAFQTNLLALNAAVEAARAGDQGKGFAVVADAVRALAQRSASAAKDITHLIQESVTKIDHGSKVASLSSDVLQSIMNGVKKIADLNEEIASASQEQTQGIEQISLAMNQLDQVSQSNAASSENISVNVVEISDHIGAVDRKAHQLKALIDGKKAS